MLIWLCHAHYLTEPTTSQQGKVLPDYHPWQTPALADGALVAGYHLQGIILQGIPLAGYHLQVSFCRVSPCRVSPPQDITLAGYPPHRISPWQGIPHTGYHPIRISPAGYPLAITAGCHSCARLRAVALQCPWEEGVLQLPSTPSPCTDIHLTTLCAIQPAYTS